ncbi:hypothetical protein LWI28_017564 [Acer negundo]|uniref:Tr-type G domain-containing protein n=1 Tax=Acer negundo TaxID=4023 RepID=A0AAD5ID74_ACENE|nr:hypothetical protein LWI28_017564 [Acer negundo]
MRNQILANAAIPLPSGEPTKRPKYQTNKSKPREHKQQEIVAELDSQTVQDGHQPNGAAEPKAREHEQQEIVAELDSMETVQDGQLIQKPENDDDEEWDAKSWDDNDINLNVQGGAFDDEDNEPPVNNAALVNNAAKKNLPEPEVQVTHYTRKKVAAAKNKPTADATPPKQADENLRSPICCIMGHVDAGKTKLLDFVRGTNVQEGEAGFITQQIGATYFPAENIRERTKELKADAKLKVPGLLVIDTPGHESFTNLCSRGSGLCDIAILVDIMEGLKPQTIESLNLLKMRNTEFIIALNKVDRLYGWKTCRNAPIVKAMKQQSKDVQNLFNTSLTQKTMVEKLTFSNVVQCTVLEVKVIEGHGTTIDVVLVNGVIHEGDQIVVCGLQASI